MEQTTNIKLPLIDTNNAEDLKKTFIDFVKMICGKESTSAFNIIDTTLGNIASLLDEINGEVV